MSTQIESDIFTFSPTDNKRLAELCGQFDEHLRLVEKHYHVTIKPRGNSFHISGNPANIEKAKTLLNYLYTQTADKGKISSEDMHMFLQHIDYHLPDKKENGVDSEKAILRTRICNIQPKGANQQLYLENISQYDINFAIGPAGTGKTYLAVAAAVGALEQHRINRIILVRPAVEAGERLGFLPGDLAQKVDPYLRPLYDALYEMLGAERVQKFIERNTIEIAPLAYMRGRTLNDAFIILDEGQNTTKEQMKMFLTRVGFGSIVVVTGDITQIDLPRGVPSGLCHAIDVLRGIDGISFLFFKSSDVVRHPLVQKIVNAYQAFEDNQERSS